MLQVRTWRVLDMVNANHLVEQSEDNAFTKDGDRIEGTLTIGSQMLSRRQLCLLLMPATLSNS